MKSVILVVNTFQNVSVLGLQTMWPTLLRSQFLIPRKYPGWSQSQPLTVCIERVCKCTSSTSNTVESQSKIVELLTSIFISRKKIDIKISISRFPRKSACLAIFHKYQGSKQLNIRCVNRKHNNFWIFKELTVLHCQSPFCSRARGFVKHVIVWTWPGQ